MSERRTYAIRVRSAEEVERERQRERQRKQLRDWLCLPKGHGNSKQYKEELRQFASQLRNVGEQIGFKISSRGWCYQLEGFGIITKDDFDKTQDIINDCRKKGLLPVDFVKEDKSREFDGVEIPDDKSTQEWFKEILESVQQIHHQYTPDWWEGEKYYIQMLVEKIDLKTLFYPVCEWFKIPIATTKGWGSILQLATLAKRFKQAEEDGLKCVLLYCGDHDPDGLQISESLRNNLNDLKNAVWSDGEEGYDPENLIIDRFGLNYKFIVDNDLLWIDNLITSSGKDLADPSHPHHEREYVQDYIEKYGVRKCEANAIVVQPARARGLCVEAIQEYLGDYEEAKERFKAKREALKEEFDTLREDLGLESVLKDAIEQLDELES